MEMMRRWAWSLSEDLPALSEYREVACCALLKHKPTQKPVMVVCTRFSSNQNDQVLSYQACALLRRLVRIRDALVVPVPVVIGCDINASPQSECYRTLTQGLLDIEDTPTSIPQNPAFKEDKKNAYEEFNRRADRLFEELEQCQLIPRPSRVETRRRDKSDSLQQPLPFQSAAAKILGHDPEFTVYTAGEKRCRDYILVSGIEPVAVLDGVREKILSKACGLPSPRFPSAHLPVI